eukprot:TRINITY_DN3656_c0_g1_i1.p1 TRINITY_DN3656_c0_g1~~TRINITY_DN3656_c0_g1_i1.p1  ORF type:complete len:105 (+),score=10.53 TRINITY_DN3656_c0_g1_i1:231-545(+)
MARRVVLDTSGHNSTLSSRFANIQKQKQKQEEIPGRINTRIPNQTSDNRFTPSPGSGITKRTRGTRGAQKRVGKIPAAGPTISTRNRSRGGRGRRESGRDKKGK